MDKNVGEGGSGSGSKTVVANGIRIAFRSFGCGPVLLPIMGYCLSGKAWPPKFITSLARSFTVVVFDNRGTGDSDKPIHGYSIRNMARDALGLLDALEVKHAHVLGYSMGGAIAQELSCAAPDRVSRLVLCSTWSGVSSSVLARPEIYFALATSWFQLLGTARQSRSITYTPGHLQRSQEAGGASWEFEQSTPPWAAALQFEAMRRFEILHRLATVTSPTLVLTGTEDRLVPPENASMIATRIPGAQLHLLPGLGHRVFWEAPDCMAETIRRFLLNPLDEDG